MLKTTPLHAWHSCANARTAPFAGYEMPIFYSSIQDEHRQVRGNVGLFDVSHMGRIRVKGKDSLPFLEYLTTNQVSRLESFQAQYNLLIHPSGGIVDDIYVYCLEPTQDYLLCVNAANHQKVWNWLQQQQNSLQTQLVDETENLAQLAIQGPFAPEVLAEVFNKPEILTLKKNRMCQGNWRSWPWIFATSGYTGEKGGEVFIPAKGVTELWEALLKHPRKPVPVGLGARDTLRLEMGYPLYGQDIHESTNPILAGLGWVIKKDHFLGVEAVKNLQPGPLGKKRVGFILLEAGIPRENYKILNRQLQEVGWVTSGTLSPSLGKGIGMGYVAASLASAGEELFIEIRKKMVTCRITDLPFYRPQ